MTEHPGRARLVQHVREGQRRWRQLVADVGTRTDEPGAMGEWTFKDVAAHLTGWRRRTIARLHAAARGEPPPPNPWPHELGDEEDDPINAWMHEQTKDLPADEILADADAAYDDLVAAVDALPDEVLTDPRRFEWMEGVALADGEFMGHFEEHEADVRRWLGRG